MSVVRDLAYVQWDPIAAIAPSHVISLWSRVGGFKTTGLDRLLWDEKRLFEHWGPIAMIVLTEDYPLFRSLMDRYPESLTSSWGSNRKRARKFMTKHVDLRNGILKQLEGGPMQLNQFTGYIRTQRDLDGWGSGSEVSHMLHHMQMCGDVMVVGHEGNQNVWGLSKGFLPNRVFKTELSEEEFECKAAERSVRALGTASSREIHYYFVRGRYQNLKNALGRLQEESKIHPIHVSGLGDKEERYIHDSDLTLLDSLATGSWHPRTTLIAPFDNLISGRRRTNRLFGFDYVHEQFLPVEKRKYGTFVLPILRGERLIGRADLLMDRKKGKLLVKSLYAEPGAPEEPEVPREIVETLERLSTFLGGSEVEYSARVPPSWKGHLS